MKNIKLFLLLFFGSIVLMSFKAIEQNNYSLTIEIENLRNSKGVVQIALYNKAGSIPDEHYKNYFKMEKVNITNGKAEYTFSHLPKGDYAVNILHDENINGKIDKGLILPKEGIGFSNFTSIGLTNRPNFKKASFEFNQNKTIKVKMIYL